MIGVGHPDHGRWAGPPWTRLPGRSANRVRRFPNTCERESLAAWTVREV